jgi:hypothetical protein
MLILLQKFKDKKIHCGSKTIFPMYAGVYFTESIFVACSFANEVAALLFWRLRCVGRPLFEKIYQRGM